MTEKKTEERSTEEIMKSLRDRKYLKITDGGTGCTIEARIDVLFYLAADRGQHIDEEGLAEWWEWKEKQGYIILIDGGGTVYQVHAKKAKFLGGGISKEDFLEQAGEGRWLETESE